MKKLFIIALAAMVSACACFECEDETLISKYQSSRQAKMDCDYFDGRTCYRYTYRDIQRPVVQPVVYREQPRCRRAVQQVQYQPTPCATGECPRAVRTTQTCGASTCNRTNCDCANQAKISETREPVEVVYRKTTLKTVYEPKTYSEVSYEKAPYETIARQAPVEVVETTDNIIIEDVK